MKTANYSILLLIFFFSACTHEKTHEVQAEKAWKLELEKADTLLRHSVESIDFLALEYSDKAALFNVNKLLHENDRYYLLDCRSNKIAAYDADGMLQFVINNRGAGPQEYLEIKSFAVDSLHIYTIDNYKHQLQVYSAYDGSFQAAKKLAFVAWDMAVLPDGHFIFSYIPFEQGETSLPQDKYKLFITDKDLNIKKKLLKYTNGEFEFIGRDTYFTESEEGVVFNSVVSDDLYLFVNKDSVRHMKLDISKGIPYGENPALKEVSDEGYNFLSKTPILHKSYLYSFVSEKDRLTDYLYNISSGQLSKNDYIHALKGLLTPLTAAGDYLLSYLDDYSLYKNLVDNGFERADETVEKHLTNEGAVILKYKLK